MVFNRSITSVDEAKSYFASHWNNRLDPDDLKVIDWTPYYDKNMWDGNVISIGLSAGFIEPLESNGLYSTHEFLFRLVRILNRGDKNSISQFDKDSYDSACKSNFDQFAEFVASHYAMSHREDTEYWRDVNTRQYSKKLVDLKAPFTPGFVSLVYGKFRDYEHAEGGNDCISMGMRNLPMDLDTLHYTETIRDEKELKDSIEYHYRWSINKMEENKFKWDQIAKKQPKLIDCLKKIHNNGKL